MVDLRSSLRKLADAGDQFKTGLEDKAQNLRDSTEDKIEEKRLNKLLATLGSGSDAERAAAAGELHELLGQRPEWREQIIEAYLKGLLEQTPGAQWAIIEILRKLQQSSPEEYQRFQKAVASCLGSPHSVVRQKLYHIWAREARESKLRKGRLRDLHRGLSDSQQDVRYGIAEDLLRLSQAIPKTMAGMGAHVLKDTDWRVAYHGARILAYIAARQPELVVPFVPQLGEALQRQAKMHEQVVEALGYVGAFQPQTVANWVPLIEEQLHTQSMNLRKVSARALGHIGGKDPDLVQNSLERLKWMLKGDEWMVHPAVLRAMGRIGHTRPEWFNDSWELIERRAEGGTDPAVAQAAQWAIDRLEGEAPPPVFKRRKKGPAKKKVAGRRPSA